MPIPKLRFKDNQGRDYPDKIVKRIESLILEYKEKVDANSNLPILTSSKQFGIEFQEDHFAGKQRHDIEGYNVLPRNYCTYRNRSDGLDFKFNINTICEKGIISKFYPVFKGNNCNLYFLKTLLNNDPATLRKIAYTAKGTSQKVLSITDLKKITVTIPTLPEQEKIADFLSNYDRMIDVQSLRVEAMKTRKKGLLQKIFSQKIRFKDDQGKNYPAWEGKYLSDIASFHSGLTYTPGDVVDRENGILVFRSSNVQGGRICYSDNVYVNKKLKESNYVKIHDIVVCVRNGSKSLVGKNALITENDLNATWGAFMTVIRAKENPGFIHQYLNSDYFKKEMYKDSGTATINQITTAMLNNCKLLVPSLPEQQKIADFFNAVDKQIEIEEKRLETMKIIKKGLLQQMFI